MTRFMRVWARSVVLSGSAVISGPLVSCGGVKEPAAPYRISDAKVLGQYQGESSSGYLTLYVRDQVAVLLVSYKEWPDRVASTDPDPNPIQWYRDLLVSQTIDDAGRVIFLDRGAEWVAEYRSAGDLFVLTTLRLSKVTGEPVILRRRP